MTLDLDMSEYAVARESQTEDIVLGSLLHLKTLYGV